MCLGQYRSRTMSIFVSYCCYHKIPQMKWLKATHLLSWSSGGQKSEVDFWTKIKHDRTAFLLEISSFLGENLFPCLLQLPVATYMPCFGPLPVSAKYFWPTCASIFISPLCFWPSCHLFIRTLVITLGLSSYSRIISRARYPELIHPCKVSFTHQVTY